MPTAIRLVGREALWLVAAGVASYVVLLGIVYYPGNNDALLRVFGAPDRVGFYADMGTVFPKVFGGLVLTRLIVWAVRRKRL